MTVRIECVDIDCRDPQQLARFWMQALDYEVAWEAARLPKASVRTIR